MSQLSLSQYLNDADRGLACGPTTLDTVVRNSVSMCTSPERMRRGGRKFRVDIYSEDYES